MIFFDLLIGYIFTLQVIVTRNPVPNPGMTDQAFITNYFPSNSHEGEGCCTTAGTTEAASFTADILRQLAKSGNPPPKDYGPQHDIPTTFRTQVQKRSFARACRRTMRYGSTWYQGRLVTPKDFPSSLCNRLQDKFSMQPQPTRPPVQHKDRHRLRLFQWNPGGLTQGAFLEFKIWLQTQQFEAVILSETRWSFTSTWSDDQWAYIHSASEAHRSGGVLIMLARSWIHPDQIGYHVELPGRILHARIHFGKRAMDIIAVYQFVDYRTKASMEQRRTFWDLLDQYLHRMPLRNQLICSGDFNCSLIMQVPWCGTSGFRWKGHSSQGHLHKDHHHFQTLLATHNLVALNTWDESTGPTFKHGDYGSRIDYICTRHHACDGLAKAVCSLPNAEIVPLNSTHHIPIMTSIRKIQVPYQTTKLNKACNLAQRAQCRMAQLQDTPAWTQLTHSVSAALTHVAAEALDSENVIRSLHTQVIPDFQQLFPTVKTALPAIDHTECKHTIHTKWQHHKAIVELRHGTQERTPHMIFQVWRHWSCFRRLQRNQQKQARQARARRFQALCQDVQVAADRHDAHGMFKLITQHTPKITNPKIRLRTEDVQIADQYSSHSILVEFVQRTWQGPSELPKFTTVAPGVPFDVDQICRAIARLQSHKSVAFPFLPAVIWKCAAPQIARFLHQQLCTWWGQYPPVIPRDWKDAWLYFIPKPGKPCNSPENLRPISLMETFGKLILGLIAEGLKHHLEPWLCQQPQLGFLSMRGSLDAITRVSQHCSVIRSLVGNHHRTVARQMTMNPCYTVAGGIQMFLDLKRAFDCADRICLIEHLHELHTPHNLLTIITHWHEGTRYHVVSPHTTSPVDVGVGLRQGCKIAPLLWLVYMSKLIQLLLPYTGETWIQNCLTLYADDVHVGCQFTSKWELDWHLQCMGHLLDCIEKLKLTLSYQKTFILLATTGSNARRALKRCCTQNSTTSHDADPSRKWNKNRAAHEEICPLFGYNHVIWCI